MYHRVAAPTCDPWDLSVSPQNFEAQMALLQKTRTVLPLPQLLQALLKNKLPPRAACVTFDDGYTDNYLFAKPILERYNIPATFFIPSHYIGKKIPFWWDELEATLLAPHPLPQLFQMPIADEDFQFDLKQDATLTAAAGTAQHSWRWPQPPPTRRCEMYLKLWEQLRPLPLAEIEPLMTNVKMWANAPVAPAAESLPMTASQLHALTSNPLFTIGLHTATHAALAYHTEDVQYTEMAENRKALQPWQPLAAIAFPYGNYNGSTLAVLKRQRLEAGFTTEPRSVGGKAQLHCLGRFQVKNWSATIFEKELKTWQRL